MKSLKNSLRRSISLALAISINLTLLPISPTSKAARANESAGLPATAAASDQAIKQRAEEAYGKLPMSFELNQGQADPAVKYLARGRGYGVLLTETEAVLALSKPASPLISRGHGKLGRRDWQRQLPSAEPTDDQTEPAVEQALLRIGIETKGQQAGAGKRVVGVDELPGKSNYLTGNDPQQWRKEIPNYARVEYQNAAPGVTLAWYGNQQKLEYDLILAPGADPRALTMKFDGADKIELNAQGDLVLHTAAGEVIQRAPFAYQEAADGKHHVPGRYVLQGEGQVGIEMEAYDKGRRLVIDPVIEFAVYTGAWFNDTSISDLAIDSDGNVYVTGLTASAGFPTKNPIQPTNHGGALDGDAFVTKISSTGSELVYSTYLGGSKYDLGSGIAVDIAGNAYVTGKTESTDFPLKNPLQPSNRGSFDLFLTKINASGSDLAYSTYIGGTNGEDTYDIAVDTVGNAYIAGGTASTNFPIKNAFQPIYAGSTTSLCRVPCGSDAFITKVNAAGSDIVFSTYLGGKDQDVITGIALDTTNNIYVTGNTTSIDFPTRNPIQLANRGKGGSDPLFSYDAFVAKLNAAGSALVYSTYLGGSDYDGANDIAVDTAGNAYVIGSTNSTDFPIKNAFQSTNRSNAEERSSAFVTKINTTGSDLVYSTYLGGSDYNSGLSIAVDTAGNVYVTGETGSSDFPLKNPFQATNRSAPLYYGNAFVTKISPAGSELVYSTYLGGSGFDDPSSIVVDSAGNAYLSGSTLSTNFPIKNPIQAANGGGLVAFVTKINAAGSDLAFSTYLGGDGTISNSITVDTSGNAYITGFTDTIALDLAFISSGKVVQFNNRGLRDAFVMKINAAVSASSAFSYATYLGGSAVDEARGIAIDATGNAYVTGFTRSANFPTKNPLQNSNRGGLEAFVAKLNTTGSDLVYSSYLGGSNDDAAAGIAVDSAGNAYVSGYTTSTDFNTRNPIQPMNRGDVEAFVAKVNAAGSDLAYSTYLGGNGSDVGRGIAVDAAGNAYVVGTTGSPNLNVKNAVQPNYRGGLDAFVAKLNSAGSDLAYLTYLGGGGADQGNGIAVDAAGAAYVTGLTGSNDFPTRNPLQANNRGNGDAFVTKLNAAGADFVYSTYFGGSGADQANGIAVDSVGNAAITGTTFSTDLPTRNPVQVANRGGSDAFITHLTATGSDLSFSTYLGGISDEQGNAIAIDRAGSLYVTGYNGSYPDDNVSARLYSGAYAHSAFVVKIALTRPLANVSAASFSRSRFASESIIAAFGSSLATTIQVATATPLPTTLAGTTVKVRDNTGTERASPLFFVSPTQVNYLMPAGTANGAATVTVISGDTTLSAETVQIVPVAPGLFSANASGQGVAAAVALRVRADGSQSYEPVGVFDPVQSKVVSNPIDLGPATDQVFLILYGTGFRFRSALSAVMCKLGGTDAQVLFAGAQGDFAGLDQANVLVPRSLAGRGEIDVVLTVDGQTANTVRVNTR